MKPVAEGLDRKRQVVTGDSGGRGRGQTIVCQSDPGTVQHMQLDVGR